MNLDDSVIYLKFASAILLLDKKSKLTKKFCEQIETTDREFSQRHQFYAETITHCIHLNIINQKAYPFEYLRRKHQLPLSKNLFSKEKVLYSKMLVENCEVCK